MKHQSEWDSRALRSVIERDDVEALKEALDQGLDAKSWFDADAEQALLSVAILEDSVKCVELLLEEGDWALNASFDEDLESPLALALERGSDEVLMLFVEGGTVARYPEDWLRAAATGLAARTGFGEPSLAFLEALTSRPEGIEHLLDSAPMKALRKRAAACAKDSTGTPLADRWSDMAERLRRASGQVDALLKEIEQLAGRCHVSRVKELLGRLPSETRRHAAGLALIYAAAREDLAFAHELVEMGADCTVQTMNSGETALMNATRRGELSLIRKLLDRGANLYAREKGPRGKSAIEMAPSPMIRRYLEKLAAGRE